jgi:uncharacterized protein (DUF1778 family)
MSVMRDQRLQLTIPYPAHIPRGRGINATGKFSACKLKMSCTLEEKALLEKAAEKAHVSQSEFVRWCVLYAAKEVMKDEQAERQDDRTDR